MTHDVTLLVPTPKKVTEDGELVFETKEYEAQYDTVPRSGDRVFHRDVGATLIVDVVTHYPDGYYGDKTVVKTHIPGYVNR